MSIRLDDSQSLRRDPRETRRMHRGGVRRYVSDLAATWPIGERPWSEREATVLVADVCGFTRLSERLAPFGAEGTEAVKDIINSVFEPCIDHALRAGGDIVKFAGDGFLALFEGDDHTSRAAQAAAAMQRTVRRLDTVRTPAGRTRARMTIGAETGAATVLLLGDREQDRRDLVVAGAVVDDAFAIDSAATPGQARVGERLAAALPAGWSRTVRGGGGRQLAVPAIPEPGGRARRRTGPDEPALRFLDPAVRAVVEHGRSLAEHRTITVAFVVIDGSGPEVSAADPGALTGRLGEISATAAAACREHDVCWLESDSEKGKVRLLLTVGAPIRQENDTERLVAAVRTIADRHHVAVGVARGRAFVGDVGHDQRRTYNVMGSVVNLAARVAAQAAPGSILVNADVANLVAGAFDTAPAPSLRLKGIARPIEVAEVVGRRTRPTAEGPRHRLHGREHELRTLRERLDALAGGRRAAVEIVADAGLGKTRLVDEVAATAGIGSSRAHGERDRRTTPYAAISSLLRGALGVPDDASTETAGAIVLDRIAGSAPHLLSLAPLVATAAHATVPATDAAEAVAAHLRGARTREVTTELLAAVRPEPTLFVAEDVHWFDDASRLLVVAIASVDRPWMVLATRRTGDDHLDGFDALALAPLDERATREAVLDTLPESPMSRRQLAEIVAASAGNPLFARELASVAVSPHATIPHGVEEIIASRIDHLDLDSRLMLRDLAAAGDEADRSTVDVLLAEHGLGEEALVLMGDFVALTERGVRFHHDLYRRTAYEGLSVRRRRELHTRFATALTDRADAGSQAAAIAEHAHHARDAPMVWRWARSAARDALAQGAAHEAAVHLTRALEAAAAVGANPAEEADVAESLGDAWELVGRSEEAHAAYRRARRALAGDPTELARLCRKHARVDQRAGRYRASLRWSTRGLGLLDGRDDGALAAELLLAAGVVRFFQGRFDAAIEQALAAAEAAERAGANAPLAQAHLQLEMTYSELGRKAERAHHGARALELLEELEDRLGLANLHLNLGVSQYNEANWRVALGHYERSAHYFRLVGDTIGAEAARNNQAEILTDQGRLDEAAEILVEVERALRAAQYALGVAMTTSSRARIALRRGDPTRSVELLATARAAFVELDARHMVLDTDVRRVEHLVWAGEAAAADDLAQQVERELAGAGPVAVLPATLARLRGWAAVRCGDTVEARAQFRRGLVLAEDEAFDYEVALALDALIATGVGQVADDERRHLDRLVQDLDIAGVPRPPWFLASAP